MPIPASSASTGRRVLTIGGGWRRRFTLHPVAGGTGRTGRHVAGARCRGRSRVAEPRVGRMNGRATAKAARWRWHAGVALRTGWGRPRATPAAVAIFVAPSVAVAVAPIASVERPMRRRRATVVAIATTSAAAIAPLVVAAGRIGAIMRRWPAPVAIVSSRVVPVAGRRVVAPVVVACAPTAIPSAITPTRRWIATRRWVASSPVVVPVVVSSVVARPIVVVISRSLLLVAHRAMHAAATRPRDHDPRAALTGP